MELSRSGAMEIRFGGMSLCTDFGNPELPFGETIAEFSKVYPLPEEMYSLPFETQLDVQAELFEGYLLEPFAEIDSVSSLLDYQERILEDRLSLMPADMAAWECVYLRDYDKALRYALIWEKLAAERMEEINRQEKAALMDADLNRHDRLIRLRDHGYNCKRRMHTVYAARRFIHLLEAGAYPLLQENIRQNIAAANAAFYKYTGKE
jgi:hypothetical protein